MAETLKGDDVALGELIDLAYGYQHDRIVFEFALKAEGAFRQELEAFLCRPQVAGGAS